MKLLFIVSCFAPKNIIGAVRISKIAKYLVRNGHDITVISPVLEDYDSVDETLECEELKEINRITVPYSKITSISTRIHKRNMSNTSRGQVQNQINDSFKSKIYRRIRNDFANWRDYEWTRSVNKTIHRLSDSYDVVFSSYPNLSAHDSAFFAKKTGAAKCWIADFRDPVAMESSVGRRHERQVKKQSEIIHHADKAIYVTKAGAANFICYPEDKHKIAWIPNGFDEEDFKDIKEHVSDGEKTNQLVFCYAGGMYGGERDCKPLFKALKNLVDCSEIREDDVLFKYAGPDFRILEEQAAAYNLTGILSDVGKISRKESLNMQYTADCVVVATFCYRDGEGAMPGKIYEPIMMKKPILMMVSGSGHQCEAAVFVRTLRAGCSYEEVEDKGDVSQIELFIKQLIEDKQKGEQRFMPDDKQLELSRYQNIARRVIEIATEGD